MESVKISLDTLVAQVEQSPLSSMQEVVNGILQLINDPHATVKDLKSVVELDPPLFVKVLSVANSSYYGRSRSVSDIEEAVIWIGLEELKKLVLQQKLASIFLQTTKHALLRKQIWQHSVATAMLAKLFYRREFKRHGDLIYAVALMHSFGLIVVEQFLSDEFDLIVQKITQGASYADAEFEVLGFTQFDLAMALFKSWQIPSDFMDILMAVAHEISGQNVEVNQGAMTLYLCNYLAHRQGIGPSFHPIKICTQRINKIVSTLNIEKDAVKIIVTTMKEEFQAMEEKGLL